jgi:hypothetical protein
MAQPSPVIASYSARAADNWITVARSLRSAALHVALRRPGPYRNSTPAVVPRWKCHGVRPGCRGVGSLRAILPRLPLPQWPRCCFRQIQRRRSRSGRLTALRNRRPLLAGELFAETWEESVTSAVSVPRICAVCGKVNHRSWAAARWFASRDSPALRLRVYCCPASGNSWHLTSRRPPRRLRGRRRGRQNGFSRLSRGGRARRRGDCRDGWS